MRIKALALVSVLCLVEAPTYAQVISGPAGGGSGGGAGSVVGPGSATDGDIALFDGTTGQLIKDGGTLSSILDGIGSTRGSVIYRGASGWAVLAPGTSGNFLKSNGAGADPSYAAAPGGGTVTSVATGNGLKGGAITTTGTIDLTNTLNAQTGTSYALDATDAGKIVSASNASAQAYSIVQANTANFNCSSNNCYGTTVANINAGTVTVTAATSTFGNGKTTLPVLTGQFADIVSNGTNYLSALSLFPVAADALYGNFTGTTEYPSSAVLPSCSTGASALTYNTTTHAFGCNSISGSGTVNSGTAGNGTYYATTAAAVSDAGSAQVSFGGINVTSSTTTGISNGMFLSSANTVMIRAASGNVLQFSSAGVTAQSTISSSNASGFNIVNGASSATVPVYAGRASTTTGVGFPAAGSMSMTSAGTEIARMSATGIAMQAGVLTLKGFTVAGLPASPATGSLAYVTDQTAACSYGGTPAGSGSNVCKVWYNGTAWIDG